MTDPGQVREEAEAGGGVQAQGGVQAGQERLLSESGEDGLQSRGRSGEDQTDSLQWNHRTMICPPSTTGTNKAVSRPPAGYFI